MAADAITSRLKALIFFRALFVTLLLGVALISGVEYFYDYPKTISFLIIVLYVLTIVYSLINDKVKSVLAFAYAQLVIDICAEIALIYITGGIDSWFSFMLILSVLSSSIVVNANAGYIMASLSSILYGTMLDLQFYRLIPLPLDSIITEKGFLYNTFIHILSFYATAYLGGYLAKSLAKTEQLLEEQDVQLRDLELFNVKVIESLPSGLFTTDMFGTVLIFNRSAEKITGKDRKEVIGVSIASVLPFLGFPFRVGRRDVTVEAGAQKRILGMNISVLKDSGGNDTGYIGVFQDLTQLKKLEDEVKQKEKWAAIGELSSNIAHEIRNPLASMKGSLEMMRDDRIPPRHKDRLMEIALQEMERLDNIVADFLNYSRPRQLELQLIDLHLVLDETLALLRNIGRAGVEIQVKKLFEGPLEALVDQQKIRQVFWNLGKNAIEAMGAGGTLTVGTQITQDKIMISFEDTGAGIKPEDLGQIFFPFFTTKDSGTGLGLSIAYRIVEEHGGVITVSSTPGTHTIFTIILKRLNGEV